MLPRALWWHGGLHQPAHANQQPIGASEPTVWHRSTDGSMTSPLPQKQKRWIYLAACGIPPSSSGVPPPPALQPAVFTASGGQAERQTHSFCSVFVGSRRGHLWRCLRFREQWGLLGAQTLRVGPVWAGWMTPGSPERRPGPRGPNAGYREEGREQSWTMWPQLDQNQQLQQLSFRSNSWRGQTRTQCWKVTKYSTQVLYSTTDFWEFWIKFDADWSLTDTHNTSFYSSRNVISRCKLPGTWNIFKITPKLPK